ncbi:two-component system sensor histidine kinase NtrB [Thermomonas haemolytica]|uniref:Sensory histidine kinase/phosphatase NtrB n=1 Tax=Thermomonas haemolytica TaxID=141949 RepID=A0A4R3N771_9GAMM|nr:ATP-binding protein [Thermomonas haemolytica]TCT25119.1 two-component system nitrogen regulation sensor histidine kinase GlnL [Thermomonas haemolytica]
MVMPADSATLETLDTLGTPLLRLDAGGAVVFANLAMARWLGVGQRRLLGLHAAALEQDGQQLAAGLARGLQAPLRLRRLGLALPGAAPAQFADVWLSPAEDGLWLEAHPVDEFPGEDPAQLLPAALAASLKGLAHELRNPLLGIKGAAQLLARRMDAEGRELTAIIESEVGRLSALVDQLLSPAPPRPFAPVNIHAVLERVLRLAESDAGWAVQLQRDYDPSLPEFLADGDRLSQAVWNLVRNAIEAGAGHVSLRTRAEHGARIGSAPPTLALRLEVVDDGRGVPPELAEHLLLPLVSGRADGTGLGLALAQQVAREHRGALTWRSRPGHTVFTLLLPLGSETEQADG